MSEPFIGETRIFGFDFAPRNWAKCNGQLLAIQQNAALFALLGTTFGGNGQSTFGLPDLRERTAINFGNSFNGNYVMGEAAGTASHTLQVSEIPPHTHSINVSGTRASLTNPAGALIGQTASPMFSDGSPGVVYERGVISNKLPLTNAGGSQGHENRQPFLTLNICIALQGIFPARN